MGMLTCAYQREEILPGSLTIGQRTRGYVITVVITMFATESMHQSFSIFLPLDPSIRGGLLVR